MVLAPRSIAQPASWESLVEQAEKTRVRTPLSETRDLLLAARLEAGELRDDDPRRARLSFALGTVYQDLGETLKAALVHLDLTDESERAIDAIQATVQDTEADIADVQEDETMTRRVLDLLGSRRNNAYEAALAALREDTQAWWAAVLARNLDELP